MASRAAAAVSLERGDASTAADYALASAMAADSVGARVEAARARTLAGRALGRADERTRAVAELERAVEQLTHAARSATARRPSASCANSGDTCSAEPEPRTCTGPVWRRSRNARSR